MFLNQKVKTTITKLIQNVAIYYSRGPEFAVQCKIWMQGGLRVIIYSFRTLKILSCNFLEGENLAGRGVDVEIQLSNIAFFKI